MDDDEGSVVWYDMAAQSVRLRLSGGEEVRIGAIPDLQFRALDGEVQRLPLWLSRPQADVLGKMIDFILKRQPITTESRALLQELLPLVSDLRDELVGLSVAEDEIIE